MAGAYLQIYPGETYTYTANVLLNNVAQELGSAVLWFTGYSLDYWANSAAIINASTINSQVSVSNAGTSVNSVVTVALSSTYTSGLPRVNCGQWSLMGNVSGNVYKLDSGRFSVPPALIPIFP